MHGLLNTHKRAKIPERDRPEAGQPSIPEELFVLRMSRPGAADVRSLL